MKITSLQEAKQAAFNGSVKGLNSQNWEMCSTHSDGCLWNKGKPGLHCAVGWLVPWEDQKDSREGSSLDAIGVASGQSKLALPLREWVEERRKQGLILFEVDPTSPEWPAAHAAQKDFKDFSMFLTACQNIHDDADGISMKLGFLRLADRHNLSWPESVPK
jgi:hypothetical protein